jgi:hypothetical protein
MMPELDNERQIAGSQPQDTELRPGRTTLPESLRQHLGMYSLAVRAADRIDALDALLREARFWVPSEVNYYGLKGTLSDRIAAALKDTP